MNITPERALELAEWAKDTASYFDTTDEHGYIVTEAEEEKQIYLQISACLKSYAEILPKHSALRQKYKEIIKQEPVGWTDRENLRMLGAGADVARIYGKYSLADIPLIIKPAP